MSLVASLEWAGAAREVLVTDLGMGGLFAEVAEAPGINVKVTLIIEHPAAELRLPGVVRWTTPYGMGVQFESLGARETHYVATIMSHVRKGAVRCR